MAHSSRSTWVVVGALTFTLSLCVGCGSGSQTEEDPSFGAEEMKAAVVGDWSGTVTWKDAKSTPMALHVEHAPPASSPACFNRTFGLSTECIDMSSLAVKGTITTTDGKFDQAEWTGRFEVMGLELRGGFLDVMLPDGVTLSAMWTPSGFKDCVLSGGSGEIGTCTMSR